MKKIFRKGILISFVAMILTGCGTSHNPSTTMDVTMTDFAYLPNSFTIPAGRQITLEAHNSGAADHSLIIMKLGHDVTAHFTDQDRANIFWEEQSVAPGDSVRATFTSPSEPGIYQIVCGDAGHFESGMVAKLVVVAEP